jgi:RimJ/RimL family protein N-acetyltransferase
MGEPHVIQWWGSRAAADAAMAMAAQSETAVTRIVEVGGEAVGYAQAMDVADDALPAGAWLADVFIGDEAARGKGYGAEALRLLCRAVFGATLASALAVKVAIANERQVREIEKAGFQWRGVVRDASLGRCWLLVAER